MAKTPKPELDETTRQIAARMLATSPKRHEDMKLGKGKPKRTKNPLKGKAAQK